MSEPSIPGYENFTQIGKGGFSRVYSAEQTTLKRQVAVKVLNFGLSDDADRRSFERETELMGRVSTHPNIVTVHATAFTAEGRPCIVMEHYPGGSLAQMVNRYGSLRAEEVLEVGVAIASALEASHRADILHCDLKPQNILVSDFGQPALGDFGISTFAEERTRTATGAAAGFTLAYAAPEIIEGGSPSVGSDIYSLAATLYTLVSGRRPFADSEPGQPKLAAAEQARRILLEAVPPLVRTGIAPEVDRVIRTAMAKEPSDRPATAADFATALFEVGQELGFGTSAPRVVGGAGLRMPTSSPDDGAPAAPAIDLTRLFTPEQRAELARAHDAAQATAFGEVALGEPATQEPAAREPAPPSDGSAPVPSADPVPAAPELVPTKLSEATIDPLVPNGDGVLARIDPVEPAPTASSRRSLALGFAVLSLVVVAAFLFLSNRSEPKGEPLVTPVPIMSSTVTDPVVAPNRPSDVSVVSLDPSRVVVRWDIGTGATDDVVYEVRRQGSDTSTEPVVTSNAFAVVDDVSPSQGVCVSVLAVRSNRTSAPSDSACIAATSTAIATAVVDCSTSGCDVRVSIDGWPAETIVEMLVTDAKGRDVNDGDLNDGADRYEVAAVTDATGDLVDWVATLDAGDTEPYVIVMRSTLGSPLAALVPLSES